jgi:hypothetical protein
MFARLRQTTWHDWMAPIQVVLGLLLLAVAIAEVPSNEAAGRPACAGCSIEAK